MNFRACLGMTFVPTLLMMSPWISQLPAGDPVADDVTKLAARIDEHIAAGWEAAGVTPAPLADDAEFLRRTYLNLAGTIPPVWEVREFLADTDAEKRRKLVDRLLDHPGYVNHLADSWRRWMIPEADLDQQSRFLAPSFEGWLRDKFIDNTPYDEIARELITCQVSGNEREGAVAYIRAKDAKPENVAASVSRLFLGIQLDCAQCHDHPFAKWKQEEFWSMAAFFSGIEGEQLGNITDDTSRRQITIPDKDTVVQARFIDQTTPEWTDASQSRVVLADWITQGEQTYFSRSGANRVWAHLFGRGLVDPPDDFDENNPPSHPELLDDLAREFAAHNYDFKFLIRAITASDAYQRSSRQTDPSQSDPRWLGRMPIKGLTPRQLADSLMQATGVYEQTSLRNRAFNNGQTSTVIEALFENPGDSVADPQTTILQSLGLMNGQFISQQTEPATSNTLSAVIQSPFLDLDGKIETLYLAALSRQPTEEELGRLRSYVDSKPNESPGLFQTLVNQAKSFGQPDAISVNEQDQALADIFWALLNSSEFLFNH